MIEFAFILGNGVTRLEVVPEELLKRGKVYGCNRIYEEFEPTVLVKLGTNVGMCASVPFLSNMSSAHSSIPTASDNLCTLDIKWKGEQK